MKTPRPLTAKVVILDMVLFVSVTTIGRAQNGAPLIFGPEGTQNPSSTQRGYNRVSLIVMDQSGVSVPRAHITIVDQALGAINRKEADTSGLAEFMLPRAALYRVTILAGFKTYVENFGLESDTAKAVTLIIDDICSGLCDVASDPIQIRLDYAAPLAVEIQQQTLELLPLPMTE